MHEMSLIRPVVETVLQSCEGQPIKAVKSVHLTIGEAHDVIDEYVEGLFRHLARGTVAENASVVIEKVPLRVRCNRCGEVFGINVYREETWTCPTCGARQDYVLVSGREFRIDDIVVEADPEKVQEPAWVTAAKATREKRLASVG